MRTNNLLISFTLTVTLLSFVAVAADDLEALAGRWSVKKVNDQGQNTTQTITVKKDKFVFQILGTEDRLLLHAEGDVKLDKLGPFKAVHFANIHAGGSTNDLQEVDEEYVSVYRLESDTWTLASNFEKERDQKPGLDIYQRVKTAAETATLIIDEIEMADTPQSSTWFLCFDARVEAVTRTYHVEGKGYSKSQVSIPVALELPKIRAGQKCNFTLKLDDVEEDACTEEVDNKSTGEFTVTEKGSQIFKPEDNWRYTIRWHLK
jgi:hypothetical protein